MYFSEGRERGKVYVYTLREVSGSTTGRDGDIAGDKALTRELCPLVSPPRGGSGQRTPASSHQTSQGTAARCEGSGAWQHLAVVAAARLGEDLSCFPCL